MLAPDSAYGGQKIANTHLKYDLFVTPSIPVVTTDFAPGEHERPWPPISSTLIYGSRDAVVVDSLSVWSRPGLRPTGLPPQEETSQLFMQLTGTAITSSGRAFFGTLPKAHFVAAPSAIQVMKEQTSPEFVAKFGIAFPNQLRSVLWLPKNSRRTLSTWKAIG